MYRFNPKIWVVIPRIGDDWPSKLLIPYGGDDWPS